MPTELLKFIIFMHLPSSYISTSSLHQSIQPTSTIERQRRCVASLGTHTHPWKGSSKSAYISFSRKASTDLETPTSHDANLSSCDDVLRGPRRIIFHSSLFPPSYTILQSHLPFTMQDPTLWYISTD